MELFIKVTVQEKDAIYNALIGQEKYLQGEIERRREMPGYRPNEICKILEREVETVRSLIQALR